MVPRPTPHSLKNQRRVMFLAIAFICFNLSFGREPRRARPPRSPRLAAKQSTYLKSRAKIFAKSISPSGLRMSIIAPGTPSLCPLPVSFLPLTAMDQPGLASRRPDCVALSRFHCPAGFRGTSLPSSPRDHLPSGVTVSVTRSSSPSEGGPEREADPDPDPDVFRNNSPTVNVHGLASFSGKRKSTMISASLSSLAYGRSFRSWLFFASPLPSQCSTVSLGCQWSFPLSSGVQPGTWMPS